MAAGATGEMTGEEEPWSWDLNKIDGEGK